MLKIDKSFIDGLDSSPEDRAIVEHVIAMAKALGMTTVAEGVERPEQLAWLRRLGCGLAQGYVLSRPISATDLEQLLERRHETPFEVEPSPIAPQKPEQPLLNDPWEVPTTAPVRLPEVETSASATAFTPGMTSALPGLPRLREYRPPANADGQTA